MKNYVNAKQLSDFLSKKGIKPSLQRVKILSRLDEKKDHPTVNEIYTDLLEEMPSLSKTTVYNTINLFIRQGVIKEVGGPNKEVRYDLISSFHGHFSCTKCGRIIDIPYDNELNFDFLTEEGNKITSTEISIKGICKDCIKGKL